jgi:hypothetical protein
MSRKDRKAETEAFEAAKEAAEYSNMYYYTFIQNDVMNFIIEHSNTSIFSRPYVVITLLDDTELKGKMDIEYITPAEIQVKIILVEEVKITVHDLNKMLIIYYEFSNHEPHRCEILFTH